MTAELVTHALYLQQHNHPFPLASAAQPGARHVGSSSCRVADVGVRGKLNALIVRSDWVHAVDEKEHND